MKRNLVDSFLNKLQSDIHLNILFPAFQINKLKLQYFNTTLSVEVEVSNFVTKQAELNYLDVIETRITNLIYISEIDFIEFELTYCRETCNEWIKEQSPSLITEVHSFLYSFPFINLAVMDFSRSYIRSVTNINGVQGLSTRKDIGGKEFLYPSLIEANLKEFQLEYLQTQLILNTQFNREEREFYLLYRAVKEVKYNRSEYEALKKQT